MTTLPPDLRRFLRRLHGRAVVLRAAERTGLGLLAGAAAAFLLTALLWWQGRPTVAAALVACGGGAAVGLLWGVCRRPTVLDAAVRADRQLDFDDLLGSAVAIAAAPKPDPWAGAVLASAADRCRRLSPSAVVLSRLGVRAWGGIGLASAMALTLALLAGVGSESQAGVADPARAVVAKPTKPADRPLLVLAPERARLTGSHRDPQENERPGGQNSDPVVAPPQPPQTQPKPDAGDPSGNRGGSADDGTGGASGIGRSPRAVPATRPDGVAVAEATSRPTATTTPGTRPAGGVTAGDPSASGSATAPAGRSADGSATATAVPPWQADGWARDADAARRQIDAGRVPPAYRDLVRGYFEAR